MRVRRFVGENVSDTMGKVKRELGSEAIILQTREFRDGGFFGLFGNKKVEITAAIEEKPAIVPKVSDSNYKYEDEGVKSLITPNLLKTKEQSEDLKMEIKSMRILLEQMNKKMAGQREGKYLWPTALKKWAELLQHRGLDENMVNRLISHVQQTLPPEDWGNDSKVYAKIEANIRQVCGQIGLIQPGIDKPRIVALIGPTGVGKTTTIGKLAAGFGIVDKRKVALITADTYRVAAVEQLKTFGEIIGVPVEVVMTPSGLNEALKLHEDKELIFIDTAGRSPNHDQHMLELRAFLDEAQPDFTMLVLSATTQSADQQRIYQRFEDLTTHLIFTKLDETGCAGSILNLLGQTTLPIAYLTNGQNVPDDIEAATPYRLARYVIGDEVPHA
ncbi:flagellar biosynthetic protein FlhF [Desulfosporosinus orientis DSM 765]|uniref:Flagellar biosynthesis protein FlhF n=1 Tax=Desulfosporosinus orientis (strain ATCC 19365 / DSM 765 / NCIMB 8382 / VKM B-1628 / Singapore I) TaxID=768706 RepID=G7WHX8_DESOD|nr:flagellar biosynthesis protein FlhF [Desulfosporosinus orientis]AET70275.1 flagellar biosynthetic protein FlhF [Desulfosporosinus orientis DSM 765]